MSSGKGSTLCLHGPGYSFPSWILHETSKGTFLISANRPGMLPPLRPPEEIHTARLLLRRPLLDDARSLFERYTQDPAVTIYLTWRPHSEISETEAFIRRCMRSWETGDAFPYAITLQEQRDAIGMIELRMQGHKAELGYVLAREYWGRGYMTEAAEALASWAIAQPAIYRVWALCDAENTGSARVMEKIGMRREGILGRWIIHPNISAEPRDCYSYALTR
jgi:RimJ/RimL family protein N-acetyltransferase